MSQDYIFLYKLWQFDCLGNVQPEKLQEICGFCVNIYIVVRNMTHIEGNSGIKSDSMHVSPFVLSHVEILSGKKIFFFEHL